MRKILALLFLVTSVISAQSEFVRGVYMFYQINMDTSQMRSGLHLNWIQANGEDSGTNHEYILKNKSNLNVMGMMHSNLYSHSGGQHLVFEAEYEPNDNVNYFNSRPSSAQDNDPNLQRSSGSAGYMVMDSRPYNQYRVIDEDLHYTASFIMKRTPAAGGNPMVARVEIWCKNRNELLASRILYNNDFSGTELETKTLTFDITGAAGTTAALSAKLTGKAQASSGSSAVVSTTNCKDEQGFYSLDIRVYWYGNVTTWLDKVTIEDDRGKDLFLGNRDLKIDSAANYYKTNYSLLRRFYFSDEPSVSMFQSYKYIQDRILDVYGTDTTNGKGFAISANPLNMLNRFIAETEPHELLVDIYPILANVPSPAYTSNSAADDVGIARYTTDVAYTSALQNGIEYNLIAHLRTTSNIAKDQGKSLWYIPQMHGCYFEATGKFQLPSGTIMQRPPVGNEIKLMANLGVAYGAKGIVGYPHGTDMAIWEGDTAYFAGLISQTVSPDGIYRDHSNNLGTFRSPTGYKNIWVGYNNKWAAFSELMAKYELLGPTLVSLTWQGTKSWNNGYTAGTWNNVISNVSANVSGETNYVETGHFLNSGMDYFFIVNRRTLTTDTRNISVTFNKSNTYPNWKVTEVGTNNYWIIAYNGNFTTSYTPGEGKLFKLEPFFVGNTETLSNNAIITAILQVPAAKTLNISAGSVLNFSGNAGIYSTGTVNANGTSSQRIRFTALSGTAAGSMGDNLIEGGNCSFKYCTFEYAGYPLALLYVNQSSPVVIENCIFQNCAQGLYLDNSKVNVKSCEMKNNGYGVMCYGNLEARFIGNYIHNNNFVGFQSTSNDLSKFYGNVITSNDGYGMYITSGSQAQIGLVYTLYGYNTISENGDTEVYAGNGASTVSINGSSIHDDSGLEIFNNSNYPSNPTLYAENSFYGSNCCQYSGAVTLLSPINCSLPSWDGQTRTSGSPLGKRGGYDFAGDTPWFLDPNTSENEKVKIGKNLIEQNLSSSEGNDALLHLYDIIRSDYTENILNERSIFYEFLKSVNKKSADSETGKTAKKFMINWKLLEGDIEHAVKLIETDSVRYTGEERKWLLSDLISGYIRTGQIQEAKKALDAFRNEFDDEKSGRNLEQKISWIEKLISNGMFNYVSKTSENLLTQSKTIPLSMNMFDAYPNPFNPTTTIAYSLTDAAKVNITIYDILGCEVTTLVDDIKETGYYTTNFNGSNLASGLYFARITINAQNQQPFIKTIKMMLTK